MIVCVRKFRMKPVLKGCLLIFLLFLPSVWWIYSKCFSSTLQGDEWDERKPLEKDKRINIEENENQNIEIISNDIEENESFPMDIRHVPASVRKKRRVDLRRRYQDDQKYVNEVKEIIEAKHIEDKKRASTKVISNDIEKNETHSLDIRHVPASTQREHKTDLSQKYDDDQNYVSEVKKIIQAKHKEVKKRTNTEMISNDIEGKETYPLDIRFIPADIRRKQEKDQPKAYDDQKCIMELKKMLQGNESSRVIKFEEDFLRLFLISSNYEIEPAFWKLENFLNLRLDHNYFFHNMTFDFTQNPAYRFVTILPHRRKDGSVTIIFEIAKWDPDIVPLEHLKKVMFMIYIQTLRNPVTQASGFNVIYDFVDAGFKYVKYGTPQNLFLLHHVSFEAMPAKYVGYHLVNLNAIGNLLLTIVRPFIPKFIESIFYTHSTVNELRDFFPPSMLPVQYGGNLKEYYAADWIRKANKEHGHFPAGGQKNTF